YCRMLKKVSLPSNLKSIANYTFYECNKLETVTTDALLENSTIGIGNEPFLNIIK
ncbi:MAG: leucine-rich repeat protein, partial [Clostridia bacterium]|nr:leucine-rich repeat protein [Clostridia bacterium]